jgi:hypothetical protein
MATTSAHNRRSWLPTPFNRGRDEKENCCVRQRRRVQGCLLPVLMHVC